MVDIRQCAIGIAASACLISGCATPEPVNDVPGIDPGLVSDPLGPATSLVQFGSEEAFRSFVRASWERGDAWGYRHDMEATAGQTKSQEPECDPIQDPQCREDRKDTNIVVTGSRIQRSLTNNQVGGVDEGGVVKRLGDRVIVLRDGRLFILNIGQGDAATPILESRVDLYESPDEGTWFDELLIDGNRIVVIGYSYQYNASSYSVLELEEDGSVRNIGRFLIASEDYFDGRSYAARMINGALVFEVPIDLYQFRSGDEDELAPYFFNPDVDEDGLIDGRTPLFSAAEIYRPLMDESWPIVQAIIRCEVDALVQSGPQTACNSVAFVTNEDGELYVGPDHAYFWSNSSLHPASREPHCRANDDLRDDPVPVYRLEFETMTLSVVSVRSMVADPTWMGEQGGRFFGLGYAVARACAGSALPTDLALSLTQIEPSEFGSDLAETTPVDGRILPTPFEMGRFPVRFFGDTLIYGGTPTHLVRRRSGGNAGALVMVDLSGNVTDRVLSIPHRVERIEPAGTKYAMGIGAASSWETPEIGFTAIPFAPQFDALQTEIVEGRFVSERRSHAYNATTYGLFDDVLMGLATFEPTEDRRRQANSGISFLTLEGDELHSLGAVDPINSEPGESYVCEVSCTDWYGVTRAFFMSGRAFALTDAELIEVNPFGAHERVTVLSRTRLDGEPAN